MSDRTLFAIVLAAGESRRFGATKQLAAFGDGTLVGNAVRTAEAACGRHSMLVAGKRWPEVVAACAPLQGFFVINPRFAEGMSTSLRAGVQAVADSADAVLLMLADQPLVTEAHLDDLVAAWRASPASIIASHYADTLGPPAIFPRAYFAALCALSGDQGAKPLLEADAANVISVASDRAAIDVDRPEDLAGID